MQFFVCNGTPFLSTQNENPKTEDYPSYMVVEKDNNRSEQSRRILRETSVFNFDSLRRLSYSTYLLSAEKELPKLFDTWNNVQIKNLKTNDMKEALIILRSWNKVSSVESIATTLYIYWHEEKNRLKGDIENIELIALKNTLIKLKEKWNTWKIPWGDINRIQRFKDEGDNKLRFDDSLASLPVSGAPSWTGSIFTFWTSSDKGTKKRYGIGGNSYVSIIEFDPHNIKAESLIYFGSSGDPSSPNYFDQAKKYSEGNYKPAFLTLDQVKNNAKESYTPITRKKLK